MGIIRAAVDTARGTLADQWLDVVEAGEMGEQTLFTEGVIVRQGSNRRGNSDVISNGSVIHVYDNQFMILTDGGKIIDYSAEPGYYTVDNGSAPSLFNGDLVGDVLKDSFNRFKFGGGKPVSMKVYFLNLQEIRGIRFGTRNPVNYFDNFYNSELPSRSPIRCASIRRWFREMRLIWKWTISISSSWMSSWKPSRAPSARCPWTASGSPM